MSNKPYEVRERIAMTILAQMGGFSRIKAMIGMTNVMVLDSGVSFRFKGSRKYNYCKVILTPADLYDVELGQIGKKEGIPIYRKGETIEGAYCDMIKEFFENRTGLYLTL